MSTIDDRSWLENPAVEVWVGEGYTRFVRAGGEDIFAWWLHPWQIEDLEEDFRRAPRGT